MNLADRPALVHTWTDLDQVLEPGPRTVVMTMGALHQGHLDLVDQAAGLGGQVVVTIFVNPLQFGPSEDFEAYPRTLSDDVAALSGRGVAVIYAPTVSDMYPAGRPQVQLDPGPLGQVFEGAVRPGHFGGVLTVVLKLLRRTGATAAVFGQKDAQQLALIRQMVADLDLAVRVVAVPTRREADGLALSSRNRYLSAAARAEALALPRALLAGAAVAEGGGTAAQVRTAATETLGALPSGLSLDYLELVDPAGFDRLPDSFQGGGLLIGALRVGQTRLIDNVPVALGPVGAGLD